MASTEQTPGVAAILDLELRGLERDSPLPERLAALMYSPLLFS